MATPETNQGWFDRPEVVRWILRIFYAACVLVAAADFLVHRHSYHALDTLPGFYALYGFLACVVLVILAKGLRRVLMRPESYYADSDKKGNREEENGSVDS